MCYLVPMLDRKGMMHVYMLSKVKSIGGIRVFLVIIDHCACIHTR